MHGEPAIHDDSTLLARWVLNGSEEAFAELVRQYERLVLGAALRRTGDPELARDVAQQVFATLASKARLLLGRANLAGWLYQAARHIAARSVQSERRRRIHQQSLDGPTATAQHHAHWPLLEDALAALGATDRESLMLHYFQDLGYPEIAAALGIQETAARKRVSRALGKLEVQIRRRGLQGSAAALLAATAAHQCSMTAQASLASAALGASTTVSPPAFLTLTTIMSHASVKFAAAAAALTLTPLLFQWQANAHLREEIAGLRRVHPDTAVVQDTASLRQRQAALTVALTAKRAARISSENRGADFVALKDKLDQEVVVTFGTIENMARKLGRAIAVFDQLDEGKAGSGVSGSDAHAALQKRAQELAKTVPEMIAIAREIPILERDPAKAAHFYSTLAGEAFDLDVSTCSIMEIEITNWIGELQQSGLTLAQRPKGKAHDWDTRRDEATRQLFTRLKPKIRPSQQAGFAKFFEHEPMANDVGSGFFSYEFLTTEGAP